MKFDQHNELEALRTDVTRLGESLQSALETHRKRMSELQSEQARKTYSPQHLREQVDAERSRARQIAAQHAESLGSVKQKIESAANAWSTEHALQTAKLAEGDTIEHAILGELRALRLGQEFQSATPSQLIDRIKAAGESGNLAELRMLQQEIARRKFPSEVERIPLLTAVNGAIAAAEIEGQEQAHATLEATLETFATAADAAHELQTGRETLHGEMTRVMAKRAALDEQKA